VAGSDFTSRHSQTDPDLTTYQRWFPEAGYRSWLASFLNSHAILLIARIEHPAALVYLGYKVPNKNWQLSMQVHPRVMASIAGTWLAEERKTRA
jgi:hypothetical protein